MKHAAQLLFAVIASAGLVLSAFDAVAAVTSQQPPLGITAHGSASFANSNDLNFLDFNNHFVDFVPSVNNAHFDPVPIRTNFDNQQDFYRTHPIPVNEESHQAFFELRENHYDREFREDRHFEWHEKDRHVEDRPVPAVPEPAEYMLMSCGLALFGFIALRRRAEKDL